MTFQNLRVKLLVSPIALSTSTPLDAILGGIIFERYGDIEAARDTKMVARWGDIPMASVALFYEPYRIYQAHKMRNLQQDIMSDVNLLQQIDYDNNVSIIHKDGFFRGRDELRLLKNGINIIDPVKKDYFHLEFFVRGDGSEIKRLLALAGYIGAWRNKGYGRIYEIDLCEEPDASEDWGIVHQGQLVRPVPVSFTGGSKKRMMCGRFSNPYSPAVARKNGYQMEDIFVPHDPSKMVPY